MLCKTDKDFIQSYLTDSSNLEGGSAEQVVFPETIDELSAFLSAASKKRLPVTVSGGGTGTAGGRIPFDGATLSMERFNKIKAIKMNIDGGGKALVQAGVLVETFKKEAEKHRLFYACHPTEKTAFIGGTIATNASGARSFKYGSTRLFTQRLFVVLADGKTLDIVRGKNIITKKENKIMLTGGGIIRIPLPTYRLPEVKNSAGYYAKNGMDLIDLFIGQEGTLGVIVEADIALAAIPEEIFSCFAFFRNEEDAWSFCEEARSNTRPSERNIPVSVDPLSLEYMDGNSLRIIQEKYSKIPYNTRAAVFFEQAFTPKDEDLILGAWQDLMNKHGIGSSETWVAMTKKEQEDFLTFRHAIPDTINERVRRNGFKKMSTDIAVPDENLLEMLRFYKKILASCAVDHLLFGHIGESHLHMNLLPRSEAEFRKAQEVCLTCVKKGVALGGTASAEHGIGKTRHRYLEAMYGKKGILEMVKIKKALDPARILGLDNLFSKELLS